MKIIKRKYIQGCSDDDESEVTYYPEKGEYVYLKSVPELANTNWVINLRPSKTEDKENSPLQ